jgi:hypothetical protein
MAADQRGGVERSSICHSSGLSVHRVVGFFVFEQHKSSCGWKLEQHEGDEHDQFYTDV